MIYFDQAASSFPKPLEVTEAMVKVMNECGANPGRGGHALARQAATYIDQTRMKAASIFGCSDPKKALFYHNATVALNQAIKGLQWQKGDHIIATAFEHNSIRRPLEHIKNKYGVRVTYLKWRGSKTAFTQDVAQAIQPETKLIAMTHASNVTGTLMPLTEIMELAKRNHILTLVDASQTAGHLSINMKAQGIDMLAFPGHKGLLGPQGTGMLLVEGDIELEPIHHGGTGSFSESPNQPEQWPEKLESGTLNTPGIAGLYEAFCIYEQRKDENVPRETILAKQLYQGLTKIAGVACYGPDENEQRMPIVAFNVANVDSQEIAMILDSHYNIAVRAGLHCSPLTHEVLETTNQGIVRASLSIYNTEKEVTSFLEAIAEITAAYSEF
ncbi:aminotransferase class V-fold PLP-dependent enzyme [Lentibacillus sp. Marseille-P4043]|uniref:aminotransferase class V-fold PLP-dependent enzyme n=1 Tax=Lentibacillus sp. Marseille-P4043 TaxID=2040293 RepID=UPI000D0B0014|nr:aminotransferase class V-fold PLP-dependent enzyme [Lentibacillus sp. Marseille-P4043]